jgi:TRAP-type C4-dicarboxylate transport system substrate-binding protein
MKNRKLLVKGIICLMPLFVAISFTPLFAQQAPKPIVLKISSMAPRDMPVMIGFETWGKEIEKRTNGRVKCEFYWSESLLKTADALKGTGAGLADVCVDVAAYHPSDTPFATVSDLGYITNQVDATARALTSLYEESSLFRNQFERHNVKVMFFVPFPPVIMGSIKPIQKMEDLKGKKIRAIGWLNEVIAKLGGTPVAISVAETYESLSRKVIDGYTGNILSALKGWKLDEVAPYILDYGYGSYTNQIICMNKDKWDSLPPDIRKIIEEINAKGVDIYAEVYKKEEPRYVAPLKEKCQFYSLPSNEAARWKNLIVPGIWNSWVDRNKQYGPAQEFFNRYQELVKKYEPLSTYVNLFPK